MPTRLPHARAASTLGTRRRVHSPSWATSRTVTSVTVVFGSRKASTPRRLATNWSRGREAWRGGGGLGGGGGRRNQAPRPPPSHEIYAPAHAGSGKGTRDQPYPD